MPKWIDAVVKALQKAGIKTEGEQLRDFRDELASVSLKGLGYHELEDDQVVIKQSVFDEQRKDLRTLRQKKNELTTRVEELEEQQRAGDAGLKRDNADLRKQLETQKPLTAKLLSQARSRWERLAKKIPDGDEHAELRKRFAWPDADKGDDGKLTDEQVLANLDSFEDYAALGLLKVDEADKPTAPGAPRPSPNPKPGDQGGDGAGGHKTSTQTMNDWYKKTDPKRPVENPR